MVVNFFFLCASVMENLNKPFLGRKSHFCVAFGTVSREQYFKDGLLLHFNCSLFESNIVNLLAAFNFCRLLYCQWHTVLQ